MHETGRKSPRNQFTETKDRFLHSASARPSTECIKRERVQEDFLEESHRKEQRLERN